jgi:dihydropteroate synthase
MDEMFLYGVINASPDSLNTDSIATDANQAVSRAEVLLAEGANGIDLGGQGSTDQAAVAGVETEWQRLAPLIPVLAHLGVPLSVDTWSPVVAQRAIESGATVLNAADGMQSEEMWQLVAETGVEVVVPFLSGPNPKQMTMVRADPVAAMLEFFSERLSTAERYGCRSRCLLDPGTGFAPPDWPWEERYEYQKIVYSRLDELRIFGLPLYVALPWKRTAQHDELLEIVLAQRPEFGRVHYPAFVRSVEAGLDAR